MYFCSSAHTCGQATKDALGEGVALNLRDPSGKKRKETEKHEMTNPAKIGTLKKGSRWKPGPPRWDIGMDIDFQW